MEIKEFLDKLSEDAPKKAARYADENTCYSKDAHLQYMSTLKAFRAGANFAYKQMIALLEKYNDTLTD